MPIEERTASTLSEFTQLIEEFTRDFTRTLWFRGHQKSSYRLIPNIFRTALDIDDILKREESMMTSFKQRSIPYITQKTDDELQLMFLMQHYGAPTRLLDWTENPYIGLYFAVERVISQIEEDSAVYILDPNDWNYLATKGVGQRERKIFSIYDNKIQRYTLEIARQGTQSILAIYGAFNNSRIISQRGAFSIFGSEKASMEQQFDDKGGTEEIIKVLIPKEVAPDLRRALLAIGITESVVYPDLGGLCSEIKRVNGYE